MAKDREWELIQNAGDHKHRHEDGTQVVYESGEVIIDSRDLKSMFPNKFRELGKAEEEKQKKKKSKLKAAVAARQIQVLDDDADDEERDATLEESSQFGKDVTAEYPHAAKSDLKVFKSDDGEYTVVDADDLDSPLNKEALKRGKNVDQWVKDYRLGKKEVAGDEAPKKKKKKKTKE